MFKKIYNILRDAYCYIVATNKNVLDLKFLIRRTQLEDKILNCREKGVTDKLYCDHEIIISLTTYGRRLFDVCLTIESLMQQTFKANRIVLWIDEKSMESPLPESLIRQTARGLTIMPTKDLRSYKKLIPALAAFPEAAIITADDDLIYDFDIIERIIKAHLEDPRSIQSCRIHSMTFDNNLQLNPYEKWAWCTATTYARHFITGSGGTLYPPHSLADDVSDETVFTTICPTANDVWFTAMAKLKGTPIKKVPTRSPFGEDYICNDDVQDIGLSNINVGDNGRNDEQIKAVFSKYNIYDLIK